MNTAVVIPLGPGRLENLQLVLNCIATQTVKPKLVVIVCDGSDAAFDMEGSFPVPLAVVQAPKHEPGEEQPRNLGVRLVRDLDHQQTLGISHVWFLDSDVLVGEDCLEMYEDAMQAEPIERVLVGPYDWMQAGQREPQPELRNDPRWPSFDAHEPFEMLTGDLSAGLACFSGNLVWPIAEFERVGGFWDELHHGRCEDGELGLRAVAMKVPVSFVREARGWHLWHPVDVAETQRRNARDVPMLNDRHPWVQGEGVFVEDVEGKRFSVNCSRCGGTFPSAAIWAHRVECAAP